VCRFCEFCVFNVYRCNIQTIPVVININICFKCFTETLKKVFGVMELFVVVFHVGKQSIVKM